MTTELKLLLVEDDALIALAIEELLREAGFEVSLAVDGPSAMAHLSASEFSALVTDIRLPGTDGWALAKRARELYPDIAVVYASGDSGIHWDHHGVENSVLLQKPYTNRDLLLAVLKLIA